MSRSGAGIPAALVPAERTLDPREHLRGALEQDLRLGVLDLAGVLPQLTRQLVDPLPVLARVPSAGVLVRPRPVGLGSPLEPGPGTLLVGRLEHTGLHPGERAEDARERPLPLPVLHDRQP